VQKPTIMFPEQIMQILSAGGGLTINTALAFPDQLAEYAACAKQGNAQLILKIDSVLSQDELVRIAMAGGGKVSFKWDDD
jgi:hypothetical protein